MKNWNATTNRLISGVPMVILAVVMTGCPFLDPPEALKPLAVEKTDKFEGKTGPISFDCKVTKLGTAEDYCNFSYHQNGQLHQIKWINEILNVSVLYTFFYNNDGYMTRIDRFENGNFLYSKTYEYSSGFLSKMTRTNKNTGEAIMEYYYTLGRLTRITSYGKEVAFKTDTKGRIIEIDEGWNDTNGVRVFSYFEYDANGNIIKITNNSKVINHYVYKYDNMPNPVYSATVFKGHPENYRYLHFIDVNATFTGEQPNNLIAIETWDPVTNKHDEKWKWTRDYTYNSRGYPVKMNFLNGDYLDWVEYANCY